MSDNVGVTAIALPTHYRDDEPHDRHSQGRLCEHSGHGDMALGCPNGCEGARYHYSNDGHPECEDVPRVVR